MNLIHLVSVYMLWVELFQFFRAIQIPFIYQHSNGVKNTPHEASYPYTLTSSFQRYVLSLFHCSNVGKLELHMNHRIPISL